MHRAQPGQQLVGAERLGHVVVGAGVERSHLLALVADRREHQDRQPAPAPHLLGRPRPLARPGARGRAPARRADGTRARQRLGLGLGRLDCVAGVAEDDLQTRGRSAAHHRRRARAVRVALIWRRSLHPRASAGWRAIGKLTANDVPASRPDCSTIRPPLASTKPRQIASPSPDPEPALAAAAEERLEHLRAVSAAGSPPLVGHADGRRARDAGAAADPDRRARGRELDRVLDQVREHPLELGRVGPDQRQLGRERELDRVIAGGVGRGRRDDVVQVAPVGLRARPRPPGFARGRAGRRRAWPRRALSTSITSISSARSASVTPPIAAPSPRS